MSCHAKSVAWTNREIFPGIYNVSNSITVYWCWASLDGPIVTNSLFSQTCLSSFPQCVAWTVTSFSHGEGGDVKHTFMGGLGSYLQSTWKLVPWFVGQSVCWPLYHGIFTLICQNMLCASNVSRLHLHAHTLKVEAAAWLEDGSRVCDQFMVKINLFRTRCMLFYFAKTIEFVSSGNSFPFCLHPSLNLWIHKWLAETSQQPISQATWLKVTLHCNHCNHMLAVFLRSRPCSDSFICAAQENNKLHFFMQLILLYEQASSNTFWVKAIFC